jgi:hypothetical protein
MRFTNHRGYVSFETLSQWRPTSYRARSSRQTRGFATEIEAKQFAKAKLSEEWKVTAGTLNPHLPRRQMSASEINQWIEVEE